MLVLWIISLALTERTAAQTSTSETFTLSGTVVNSATGEAIARALVHTHGLVQRSAFTDGEGRFQIESLPAVQVTVTVQKPGYVSPEGAPVTPVQIGPNLTPLVLKLSPQSAIYGRIIDANGQALEHVPVQLTARSLRDGRKLWEQRGMAESDEDGHFRFPNLMPGTYYVSAGPSDVNVYVTGSPQILTADEKPKNGFPHLYYPGVPDLASALSIQLAPGQQTQADFSMSTVPVYQVSGTLAGNLPDQGVGFAVFTASGDSLSLPINFNMETGTFKMDAVPAGSYIVRAMSQNGNQSTRGEVRINVASNMEDLRIVLAPSVNIPIAVRTESRAPSHNVTGEVTSSCCADASTGWNAVTVRLLPTAPNSPEVFSVTERKGGQAMMTLQTVDPGTYIAEVVPQPPWYVQSATYGQTNLLLDEMYVASGQSYPMEILLRDDSANLTATVKSSDGSPTRAIVVVVRQDAGKMAPRVVRGSGNEFSVYALPPGDYLVFAFENIDDLEYANPEAFAPYASKAAHVTLTPNQKAQVSLELIHVGKEE